MKEKVCSIISNNGTIVYEWYEETLGKDIKEL
jgi:hypothetical protein